MSASTTAGPGNVEGHDGIFVIRKHENCRDWNGIHYRAGMSADNVGATELSMNVATIPPGGVAKAHIHVGFDLMLYIVAGRVRHEYGPGLEEVVENTAGDFIFIEPGVPHEVFNVSDSEPVVAVVARSAADEWDRIAPYDRGQGATTTRSHTLEMTLAASSQRVFEILHTPSAIRQWWSAARAIVLPQVGGAWAAAWGEDEDDPDYITVARIRVFEPPHRLVLDKFRYQARGGPMPFTADFTTEFVVTPDGSGARLRVTQDGFPVDPVTDEFYAACETGWHDTFEGIRRFVEG